MSKFTLKRSKGGFTLIEIMIVVLIIGILLAIAIPNFMNARDTSRTKSCIANMKQIDTAKAQYAMDNSKNTGDTVTMDELTAKYIKAKPVCPSGTGDYVVGVIDTNPTCPNVGTQAAHHL